MDQSIIQAIDSYRDGLITALECRNKLVVALCDLSHDQVGKFTDCIDLDRLKKAE